MTEKLLLYSVSDQYIQFLKADPLLKNVFDNKEGMRSHTRKYLGTVLYKNGNNYFIPFSSPKDSDYITSSDGSKKTIRNSLVPIIRITTTDTLSGQKELKGTLKISNMIPVPETELIYYDINSETDSNYKMIVEKEYDFIRKNANLIMKSADILYNQKNKESELFPKQGKKPGYLHSTVDFLYAEKKCHEFCKRYELENSEKEKAIANHPHSIHDRLNAATVEVARREAERTEPKQDYQMEADTPKR